MIRLASFLAPGDLRPRLGAMQGAMMRDLTAAHGADWDMRRVLALPIAELRAFVVAGKVMLPAAQCHLLPPIPDPGKIFCVGVTDYNRSIFIQKKHCHWFTENGGSTHNHCSFSTHWNFVFFQ